MPFLEELSIWRCLHCNAENDHTNGRRCWSCNRLKPKLVTVKRILSKRRKEAAAKEAAEKKARQAKLDIEPKSDERPWTSDFDKLIVNP